MSSNFPLRCLKKTRVIGPSTAHHRLATGDRMSQPSQRSSTAPRILPKALDRRVLQIQCCRARTTDPHNIDQGCQEVSYALHACVFFTPPSRTPVFSAVLLTPRCPVSVRVRSLSAGLWTFAVRSWVQCPCLSNGISYFSSSLPPVTHVLLTATHIGRSVVANIHLFWT